MKTNKTTNIAAAVAKRSVKAAGVITAVVLFSFAVGSSEGVYPHKNQNLLPEQCGSCHEGHGVNGSPMLSAIEEENCYQCHGGQAEFNRAADKRKVSRAAKRSDLFTVFQKPYRHPVELVGLHRSDETLPATNPGDRRHAECVDCHDAHNAYPVPRQPMKGMGPKQSSKKGIALEYELCYRCHSVGANKPYYAEDIRRLVSAGNPSYHPIEAPSRSFLNDLVPPLRPTSTINCSDCHGNDDPTGPLGPHGSNFEGLLVSNYTMTDGATESEATYSLCYSCHERSSILSDTGFRYHSKHVQDARISCHSCHDPHGSMRYGSLIDFEKTSVGPSRIFVLPSSGGRLEYVKKGMNSGECYLNCHGKDHNPATY